MATPTTAPDSVRRERSQTASRSGLAQPSAPSTRNFGHTQQSSLNLSSLANKNMRATADSVAVANTNNESLQKIESVLADHQFTEKDIWEANPKLVPIFNQLRPELDSLTKPNAVVIVTVDFSQCEELVKLGLHNKTYRIDPTKAVWQTIALIFTKIGGGNNFRRFSLKTSAGNILDDNLPLTAYALGALFNSWELFMVRKTAEQFAAARPNTGTSSGQYVVTFLPGDGPMFQGLSKVTRKVHAETPTGQLIEKFCARYRIPNPQNFVLTSTGDMLLSRKESLGYYGLGKKFDQMTVKVIPRDANAGSVSPRNNAGDNSPTSENTGNTDATKPTTRAARQSMVVSPDVAWTQLDDHLSVKEARAVILDLDRQLVDTRQALAIQQQKRIEERETIRAVIVKEREAYKELETQHDQLRTQAKQLVDVFVAVKERQDDLLTVKGALESDIRETKELLNTTLEALRQSKTENALKSEQLRAVQGELMAQQFDFEQTKLSLEQKIDQLDNDLQEESKKNLDLYSQHILFQDDIERQKATIAGLKNDRTNLELKLAQAAQTEAQLNSEVARLNKEVATALYSESQTSERLAIANQEIQEFAVIIDKINSEKRSIELSLASTKAAMATEIENRDSLLRDSTQKLETLAREKEDMKSNYEQQIKGLQSNFEQQIKGLQSTVTSQSSLETEISKLREALLNSNTQQDTLKSANKSLTERLESAIAEKTSLQKSLQDAKADAERIRSEISSGTGSFAPSSSAETDHLKKQIQALRDQISQEQKQSFEMVQAKKEAESRASNLSSQVNSLNQRIQDLTEQMGALEIAKHEAVIAAEKAAFKELNTKLSKLAGEKAEVEKQVKDIMTEKADLEKQMKELRETVAQQNATISEQKATIERLEAPPPAPFLAKSLQSNPNNSNRPANGKLSLESEILGIKDTLQKIDTSTLSKKKDFSGDNVITALLMSGLEKRFRSSRPDEGEYEDLASEDLYIPNDNEEDWK